MMGSLWRYIRLYGHFLVFSFGKAFEFRFDFYMRILMDLCYYAVALSFFRILYLHTSMLGGWNEKQIMVFVSGYLIVDAINMTVFANNMWNIPLLINKGELDYYLIRPVSSLFFVSLREFAANSFVNLLFAVGIFVWALSGLSPAPSVGQIVLFIFFLVNGSVIFYSLNVMANILVFWTHSPGGFGEVVWHMAKFSERPDGIYRGMTRKILTLILPFSVISSFPARLVLEGVRWSLVLHMLGISAVFLSLLVLLWNYGLRNYSSASS
ncbi:ABC-2 family transporter protein [Bdellovibrionota bacterium FG-2]